MSRQTYRVCFCCRRSFKVTAPPVPGDVKDLFQRYSENGVMSVDQLQRFLIEVQKEGGASREDAQGIVDRLRDQGRFHIFHRKGLTLEDFFSYLFGEINPPLSPNLGAYSLLHARKPYPKNCIKAAIPEPIKR